MRGVRPNTVVVAVFSAALLVVVTPLESRAQVAFEVVGARALGMGGAFVAVADDPTAVVWNPAGLLGGPPAGLQIGWDAFHFRDQQAPPAARAGRISAQSFAIGTWPVGISFVRAKAAGIRSLPGGELRTEALRTSQLGFTVLHSVTEHAVVGATVKYVRGTAVIGSASGGSASDVLESALAARGDAHGTLDVDIGIAGGSDRIRAGVTFKNLRRPGFATVGGTPIHLERRARLGLAVVPRDGLTLAIDVDLDTADPLVGLRRTIAIGGEGRLGARLALRGGIRWHRSESTRPIGALGGSVRLRQGFWLDGYVTRGHSRGDRGTGIALRAGI